MIRLPIDAYLPGIVEAARQARSVVVVAEPGAGKTTRVAPALLAAGLLGEEHPNLIMLQPRRVAARASAMRIADENGWELGERVGYHVRFDKRLGPGTRLRVLTEGILTRQLLVDPILQGVGAVVLDEFHERSLETDLAVAMLREVRQTVRPDLILVVMSATLEAEPVSRFLENCPVIRVEGRMFEVRIEYEAGTAEESLPRRAADAVARVMGKGGAEDPGDILVFLPGVEEIRRTGGLLEDLAARENLLVLPLHGSLKANEQAVVLRPAQRRKVILATNIAETSLTIDGVRTVIDGGYARVAAYDARRGLDRLELQRISKASAAQRCGRAGRTAPGVCVRLWPQRQQRLLEDYEAPEVRRVDLCGAVLALHAWGANDPRRFGWYEAPPAPMLESAERLLAMLGALSAESDGRITELGRRMLALPVHPRLGRLLVEAAKCGLLEEGAALAALLSEKDIALRQGPAAEQGRSDLLRRLEMLRKAEVQRFRPTLRDEGIDPQGARRVAQGRDELLHIGRKLAGGKGLAAPLAGRDREDDLLRLALWAYPDRVCRRRADGADTAVCVGGSGVRIAAESVVRRAEFFLALDARADVRDPARQPLVRIASAIEVGWLAEMFPAQIQRRQEVTYDAQRQCVVGRRTVWYRDLLLEEHSDAAVDAGRAGEVLGQALRARAAAIIGADEAAANFLARVQFLRRWMGEQAWPKLDEEELADVLAEACAGKRSLEEVKRATPLPLLAARLKYPLDRMLEREAPETITVPSGNRIRLTYAANQAPVMAVRLQELFGWTDTPRVAGGRVAVLLHLLGPNGRPVQITDDLRSFWQTTYFQVRKDLRRRYPKHAWPEEPLSAKAQARPGRRG